MFQFARENPGVTLIIVLTLIWAAENVLTAFAKRKSKRNDEHGTS